MKSYLNSFCTAAIAVAILSGCSVKEVPSGLSDNEVETSKDVSYATFDFSIEGATKAPLTGDAAEKDSIKSVRLMIYAHTNANNGACEVDTTILTTGNQTATVPLTSGMKRIFVLANEYNKSWRFGDQKGSTLDKLIATKTTTSAGKLFLHEIDFGSPALSSSPAPLTSLDYSDMVTPNMVFSNSQADSVSLRQVLPNISETESQTGSGVTKNHFRIDLQRTVAKVTVYNTATLIEYYDNPAIHYRTLSDMTWGIRNQNRAIALLSGRNVNGSIQTPLLDVLNLADLMDTETYKPYWWTGGDTTEINIPLPQTSPALNYYYVPENVFDGVGNSTYIVVKALLTPNRPVTEIQYNSGNTIIRVRGTEYNYPKGKTYYCINYDNVDMSSLDFSFLNLWGIQHECFDDEELIRNFIYRIEHNGNPAGYTAGYVPQRLKIDTYENGVCYYRFDISNNNDGGLLRNKQYRGNITDFVTNPAVGLRGAAKLSDLDKIQTQDSGSTHATATVQVLPWETVDVDLHK
ncbi:MAG: hypothetical protein LBH04_10265 [Tannerellaceae bacterium]|jgi:hypothetical protein|nr:hypothetical protein [Tannerellaceae bacterium]